MLHRYAAVLVAMLAGAAPAPSVMAQPKSEVAGAAPMRAKAAREGHVRVIVELTPSPKAGDPQVKGHVPALGGAARPLGSLPFAAMEVDAQELEALIASGAIRRVGENRTVRPSLRQSVPLVGGTRAWSRGARGAGQHVVVIDTGVRANHPFLAGRVVRGLCSAADCGARVIDRAGAGEPSPTCAAGSAVAEHGTHVAGIAAGRASTFSGVAPDASLISIRVFRCEEADWEYIIRALDYVATDLAPRYTIAAVNLSLGDDRFFGSACDGVDAVYAALSAAVGKLRRLGIATVAASGNEYVKTGISAPSCIEDAIAVGSSDKSDRASWFSNSASNLDVMAPGDGIYSSFASGGFGYLDGTSMAAPHVAGAIAVIRSMLPGAGVAQIEQALEQTGRPIFDAESRITKPRIDVAKALVQLQAAPVARWRGWESFGGSLVAAPECLSSGATRTDCVAALAAGGGLGWWRYDGSRRPAPIPLGGQAASAPSCVRTGGDLHCFVTTPANGLAYRTLRAGRWLTWRDLGGGVRLRPACLSVDDRSMDCVAVGTDGRLRWRAYEGGTWAPWRVVAGGLSLKGAPSCQVEAGGVECLVPGPGGAAFQLRLGADRRWAAARNLGGAVLETGSCIDTGSGRRSCFVLASGGRLQRIAHDGTRWGAWQDLGGSIKGAPSCVRTGTTAIECVAVAGDGTLRERRFERGTWLPWRSLRGFLKPERPACVGPSGARVDCFGLGRDGTLRHIAHY